jgi:hypothetical protein
MSHPSLEGAVTRLDAFIPTLHYLADWTERIGAETRHEALEDSIPFSLRALAGEIERLRDELKAGEVKA